MEGLIRFLLEGKNFMENHEALTNSTAFAFSFAKKDNNFLNIFHVTPVNRYQAMEGGIRLSFKELSAKFLDGRVTLNRTLSHIVIETEYAGAILRYDAKMPDLYSAVLVTMCNSYIECFKDDPNEYTEQLPKIIEVVKAGNWELGIQLINGL